MNTETLIERQIEREALQVQEGIARYRRDVVEKDAADLRPGAELVRRAVEPVALAIQALIQKAEAGIAGKGRPNLAVRYLCQLQPEPVAYLTARLCINAACVGDKVAKTAMSLAQMINEQYELDQLREADPKFAAGMERKAAKWTTSHHRRAIMRKAANVKDVRGLEWGQGDKLHLGMKLIELFITETGLAEQFLKRVSKTNTPYHLRTTEQTADWLKRTHGQCELLQPRFRPMLVKPRPWTNPLNGGYLTRECRLDFVSGVSAAMRDELFSSDLGDVYRAVNAIQETPWEINHQVLAVVRECHRSNSELGGLPSQDDRPIPARPADIPKDLARADMSDEMRTRFDAWRGEAAKAHAKNGSLVGERLSVAMKLSMAADLEREKEFYFPHTGDFRMRLYPACPGLTPQSDDLGKGLLRFAEGKRLGESGVYWLHVHIANLFGIDKENNDVRVQWTQDHHAQLLDSALNPLDGDRFWDTADDPWQALAACFEYAGYIIEGEDYVSHLPIGMDGCCSGVQHYSGMLLDEEAAEKVGLVPLDKPADLYSAVAAKAEDRLLTIGEPLAMSWRGKVVRKIAKQPCMTFAYSVTSRGMRDQIDTWAGKLAKGGEYLPGWTNFEAANFLAPVVESAIRDTVKRAAEGMDWLKAAVKPVVDRDEPVTWYTPDGFPVQHRYVKTTGKRFKVWFEGVRLNVQLRQDTTKQDPRKHVAAIAPNYIHSMDATHLRMVVRRCMDEGITDSFAMIHDSFGVHAADVEDLHFVIRDEFIKLYTPNRLEEFREQMLSLLPEDDQELVPPAPARGNLDLEQVRGADYFFA